MFEKLAKAENNIQVMNTNAAALNQLSGRISADTANTDYLVEAIRSAYSISGAVDEYHRQLRILENEAGQTSILMHSLLNEINSDIDRQQQYVKTANGNIANLSSAIRVGSFGVNNTPIDLYTNDAINSNSFKDMLALFTPIGFLQYAGYILLLFMVIGMFTGSVGSLISMGKYLKEQGSVVSED